MIVRLKVAMAGYRTHWAAGEIREVSAEEAGRLIQAGFAEPVTVPAATPIETATDPRPERAEKRPGPKPKRNGR